MDAVRDILAIEIRGTGGIDVGDLALWVAAGTVASFLLMGRRPIGRLGDLIVGVLGGLLGGWGRVTVPPFIASLVEGNNPELAASIRDFKFANMITNLPESWPDYVPDLIGDFVVSLIGAIVVLFVLRTLLPRKRA